MIIFSTLRSDMIDLNRTSSIGVAGLKRFLEYAEKGTKRILNTSTSIQPSKKKLPSRRFCRQVGSLGYTVHTDIGCSGYKIDIGIVIQPIKALSGKEPDVPRLSATGKLFKTMYSKHWDGISIWTMDWEKSRMK